MNDNTMFNNSNYDVSEELADRIERIISRPLFILCYTINPEMLKVYLAHYLDLHFRTEEEFGDNYQTAINKAVELIISRTHLNKNEAKVLAMEIQTKMMGRIDAIQADKEVRAMQW